uniref:Kinesin motor domain-containing protein n=1 Tax=Macrostomum lignano TaxID=282301 RepID=A0A1I8GMT4_9PLAT
QQPVFLNSTVLSVCRLHPEEVLGKTASSGPKTLSGLKDNQARATDLLLLGRKKKLNAFKSSVQPLTSSRNVVIAAAAAAAALGDRSGRRSADAAAGVSGPMHLPLS